MPSDRFVSFRFVAGAIRRGFASHRRRASSFHARTRRRPPSALARLHASQSNSSVFNAHAPPHVSHVKHDMGVNDHDTFTGLTPLHKAAAEGALDQVVALMDDGADVDIQANGEVGFVLRAIRARMIAARGRASGERGLVAR